MIELGDCVFGVYCFEWFFVVDEWIERKCLDWFFGIMIVKIVEMGCDFVLIGVIGIYMEKEWRILLVRVERYFMYILNLV